MVILFLIILSIKNRHPYLLAANTLVTLVGYSLKGYQYLSINFLLMFDMSFFYA